MPNVSCTAYSYRYFTLKMKKSIRHVKMKSIIKKNKNSAHSQEHLSVADYGNSTKVEDWGHWTLVLRTNCTYDE